MKRLFILGLIGLFLFAPAAADAETFGVYLKVAEGIGGTIDSVLKECEDALNKNGWQVIAAYDVSEPEGCGFRAKNIVVNSGEYAKKVLLNGPKAAFALPVRIGIYEDEKGINIAFSNPASLNRTVLGDSAASKISAAAMNELSGIIGGAVKGKIVNAQTGELRDKGKVGGMGGGDFDGKVEILYQKTYSDALFSEVSRKVKEGVNSNKKGWKLIYALEYPDQKVAIYGVNSAVMEARAFGIAGEKRRSKDYRCPGIDHAAAFPIEVVVYKDDDMLKVAMMDGMYRMKVYFEDAGKWAFMKNMAMPGEIEAEITEMATSGLK